MKNIVTIVALLVGGFAIAVAWGQPIAAAGRIGLAAVFLFTALGHFVKCSEMAGMLPERLPYRKTAVVLTGILEAALAIAILVPEWARTAGVSICLLLVVFTPVNIHAAIKRVGFGGHGVGPIYLAVRLPLQVVLLAWTYWFCVRTS